MGNQPSAAGRIPLVVKLAFTAFMGVMVPAYLYFYGPANFLYFCDVAMLLTLAAVWTEKPLFAGMAAVGILVPQTIWVIDFLGGFCGIHRTGMTDYMFKGAGALSLFKRGLSLFHGWLPFFLLYLVYRLGYDRRSLAAWTVLATVLLLICYFLLPMGPAPEANKDLPVNVNYVFGMDDNKPQEWMPRPAWLAVLLFGMPVLFYLPVHLTLSRLAPRST